MKKSLLFLLILMFLTSSTVLMNCSDDDDDVSLIGTWKAYMDQEMGPDVTAELVMTVVLTATTYEMTAALNEDVTIGDTTLEEGTVFFGGRGTYQVTGNQFITTETSSYDMETETWNDIPVAEQETDTSTYSISGNTLTIVMDEDTTVFTKQ